MGRAALRRAPGGRWQRLLKQPGHQHRRVLSGRCTWKRRDGNGEVISPFRPTPGTPSGSPKREPPWRELPHERFDEANPLLDPPDPDHRLHPLPVTLRPGRLQRRHPLLPGPPGLPHPPGPELRSPGRSGPGLALEMGGIRPFCRAGRFLPGGISGKAAMDRVPGHHRDPVGPGNPLPDELDLPR